MDPVCFMPQFSFPWYTLRKVSMSYLNSLGNSVSSSDDKGLYTRLARPVTH